MGIKILSSLTPLILAILAAPVAAFAPGAPRVQSIPRKTSTTLYYRDDVPPIGSAPKWDTPNDFDQFLTQCTIQSFTFLLKSLRDDHTARWLDDFTKPVFEKHSTNGSALDAPDKTYPPSKVSLEEAAQSALLETDKVLSKGQVALPKKVEPKKLEETVDAVKKQQNATLPTKEAEEEPLATEADSSIPQPPPGPFSNTGINQLYTASGIPPQNNPLIVKKPFSGKEEPTPVKKNYSPFGQKPKPVSSNPLGGGGPFQPNIPGANQNANQNSPFGGNTPKPVPQNKFTGGFMPVPNTSPLYGGNTDSSKEEAAKLLEEQKKKKKSAGSVLKYHGLAILNNTKFPTSDSYFEQLLDQPKELLLVQSYNPAVPDIELDIDPASLCRRMVSVRAQIAEEFEHDLEVIANMGGLTLQSYRKMLEEIREQRAEEELQQKKDHLENLMPKSMEDSISNHNGVKSTDNVDAPPPSVKPEMQRANLLFLERGVGEGDKSTYAPSPLRKGNFDLLCLLATQEAIHRVLNDPSRQARKSPEHGSNQFLQDFYVTRLLSHFSGEQPYGRSDDFLEELLNSPPVMISVGSTNDDKPQDEHEDALTKDLTYLVDPVKVAETILNQREVVALQWKQHVAEQTKDDHMAIQKLVLTKVMGGTVEECEVVDSDGTDVEDVDFESCFE